MIGSGNVIIPYESRFTLLSLLQEVLYDFSLPMCKACMCLKMARIRKIRSLYNYRQLVIVCYRKQ